MLGLFKKLLPQTLFGRTLIIVIAPVLFAQSITTYIFVDRYLAKVTEIFASNIAVKTSAALETLRTEPLTPRLHDTLLKTYGQDIEMSIFPQTLATVRPKNPSYAEKYLFEALESRVSDPFHVAFNDSDIIITVMTPQGTYRFTDQSKNLVPKTTTLLMWWSIALPILFLMIAILFMRNQIKPLRRLAEAVDDFGKGRENTTFKPSGSFEVRKVSQAFIEMRHRIQRHLGQRTEMLAGVSHDLRTPLTRMRLGLALLDQSEEVQELQTDVREMSKMIDDYLVFAQEDEGSGMTETIPLEPFISNLLKAWQGPRMRVISPVPDIEIMAKGLSLKRALTNILENAAKYAKTFEVSFSNNESTWSMIVEDDGPGIPAPLRGKVLRPFFRLEQSRNSETGGSGLGLAIANDSILRHGGTLDLSESHQGGLRVCVSLPL